MDPLEVVTLPALVQHLEASRHGCKLRFESIQDSPGGAVVTIIVEEAEDTSPSQMEQFKAAIQTEAEQKAQHLRQAQVRKRRNKHSGRTFWLVLRIAPGGAENRGM
jgi:hypothetical protein